MLLARVTLDVRTQRGCKEKAGKRHATQIVTKGEMGGCIIAKQNGLKSKQVKTGYRKGNVLIKGTVEQEAVTVTHTQPQAQNA